MGKNQHSNMDGGFDGTGYGGYWWSASEDHIGTAYSRYMFSSYSNVGRTSYVKSNLYYVRCLQD